jgi:antitoxin CptB
VAIQLSPHDRARLRWRARRGLLENDLILTRFLDAYEETLTDVDVGLLTELLEATDNELMDYLLGRKEPEGDLATPAMLDLIKRLREV